MTTKPAAKRTAETAWGSAEVVEEVKVQQRSGEKRFATVVQLLELRSGEPLVRVAYTTDGVVRRGPVTLRARDLDRLRAALGAYPALAAAFGLWPADAAPDSPGSKTPGSRTLRGAGPALEGQPGGDA